MSEGYDYHNCQSLFGYALETHIRDGCKCKLCDCGGPEEENFDLWRQMTVEHLIGASQGGYQILDAVVARFPVLPAEEQQKLTTRIDEANKVTSCSFCNSTTSRHRHSKTISEILGNTEGTPDEVFACIKAELDLVLHEKRADVARKVAAVHDGFREVVKTKLRQP